MSERAKSRRRFTRFKPDPGAFALIDSDGKNKKFNPEFSALMVEEAYKGGALVMRPTEKLQKGSYIWIRAGKLDPLKAFVRWRKDHNSKVMELGIEFEE